MQRRTVFLFHDFLNSLFDQNKISSGAIYVAQDTLEYLIKLCSNRINVGRECDLHNELYEIQQKSLNDVVRELIRQVCSHGAPYLS
jgi:hypothetical protein